MRSYVRGRAYRRVHGYVHGVRIALRVETSRRRGKGVRRRARTGVCIDARAESCARVCTDERLDMRAAMRGEADFFEKPYMDTSIEPRIDVARVCLTEVFARADMCLDTCMDMCIRLYADICQSIIAYDWWRQICPPRSRYTDAIGP